MVFFFNSTMTKAEAVRLEGSVRTATLSDLTSLVSTNAAVDGAKGKVRAKDAHCDLGRGRKSLIALNLN